MTVEVFAAIRAWVRARDTDHGTTWDAFGIESSGELVTGFAQLEWFEHIVLSYLLSGGTLDASE